MSNARDCAIKCSDPRFRAFLREQLSEPGVKDGLEGDEDWLGVETSVQAASASRYLLNVESRKELDEEGPAASRWGALAGQYEGWKRGI